MEDERSEEKSFESRSRRDVEQERTWWELDDESRNDFRRDEVPFHVPRD